MKIGKENVKRYSVYRFYDKDGIADEYVITFLKALKNVSSCLQVVVCGRIGHGDLERLEAVSDQEVSAGRYDCAVSQNREKCWLGKTENL